MNIKAAVGDITAIKTGAIIVTHFEGAKTPDPQAATLDKKLGGVIASLIKQGDIKGKLNEVTLLFSSSKLAAERVVVLGLGKKNELTLKKVRNAFADVSRFLRNKNISSIATVVIGDGANGIKTGDAAQAMTEGAVLGLYTFNRYQTKKENSTDVKEIVIVGKDKTVISRAITKGKIIANAVNYARDMENEPGNFMTPARMSDNARQIAKKYKLKIEVLEKAKIKALGMGGLLGVAQGSQQPPKFIILTYQGRPAKDIDIALVGKGITFDSGGISIKPSAGMADMKGDMSGGATVLSVLLAVAQLKPSVNVTAFIPATENLPSGTSYKPGDVLKAMNGKTMEIQNTDAEGRLILADALCYAVKSNAGAIIDVATLTGACQVALGTITTGVFTNKQELADKVLAAGEEVGEYSWQLPMFEEYSDFIKSDIADIRNTGVNRYAGAITAAKFLEEFVDKVPWVHLDLTGPISEKDKGVLVKGATGTPVRTLINFVLSQSKRK